MITFFLGQIEDVYETEYTKKDTGEVVKNFEVTATFRRRSGNGKLHMFTEHFRFTGEQAQKLRDSIGKYIAVPFEKRQFGKDINIVQNRDLGFQVLDFNPFESEKPEKTISKKAS